MEQARRQKSGGSSRVKRRPRLEQHAAKAKSTAPGLTGGVPLGPDVVERILLSDRFILLAKLSASMAHEIINPVSAVLNLATLMQHILKDDGIPTGRVAEFRGYLSQVIGESGRAGRIASELLAFSRASIREPGRTDPNEIVRQAFSLASHMLKIEDVECRLDLGEGLPLVYCDGTRIERALLHLLINAAEAVEGRELRRITIDTRLKADRRTVVLRISDTGEGIPDERLPRIFDPFFTTKQKRGVWVWDSP